MLIITRQFSWHLACHGLWSVKLTGRNETFSMVHDVQKVRSFEHPGAGRKRAKATPKGRQVDPTAAHEIELLLGGRSRQRDLLIEYLHLIQDKYHQISAAHLAAL